MAEEITPTGSTAASPKATAAIVIAGLSLLFVIGYFITAAQPKPRRRGR